MNNLPHYLALVAKLRQGVGAEALVLAHGRAYTTDDASFPGGGKRHECFRNAALAALADPTLTYVEGYVAVHGCPIHHAWTATATGVVRDPTIRDPKGIDDYYGVPFKTDWLTATLLHTKVYGVLARANEALNNGAQPEELVA